MVRVNELQIIEGDEQSAQELWFEKLGKTIGLSPQKTWPTNSNRKTAFDRMFRGQIKYETHTWYDVNADIPVITRTIGQVQGVAFLAGDGGIREAIAKWIESGEKITVAPTETQSAFQQWLQPTGRKDDAVPREDAVATEEETEQDISALEPAEVGHAKVALGESGKKPNPEKWTEIAATSSLNIANRWLKRYGEQSYPPQLLPYTQRYILRALQDKWVFAPGNEIENRQLFTDSGFVELAPVAKQLYQRAPPIVKKIIEQLTNTEGVWHVKAPRGLTKAYMQILTKPVSNWMTILKASTDDDDKLPPGIKLPEEPTTGWRSTHYIRGKVTVFRNVATGEVFAISSYWKDTPQAEHELVNPQYEGGCDGEVKHRIKEALNEILDSGQAPEGVTQQKIITAVNELTSGEINEMLQHDVEIDDRSEYAAVREMGSWSNLPNFKILGMLIPEKTALQIFNVYEECLRQSLNEGMIGIGEIDEAKAKRMAGHEAGMDVESDDFKEQFDYKEGDTSSVWEGTGQPGKLTPAEMTPKERRAEMFISLQGERFWPKGHKHDDGTGKVRVFSDEFLQENYDKYTAMGGQIHAKNIESEKKLEALEKKKLEIIVKWLKELDDKTYSEAQGILDLRSSQDELNPSLVEVQNIIGYLPRWANTEIDILDKLDELLEAY